MKLLKRMKWALPLALVMVFGLFLVAQALTPIDTFNDSSQTSNVDTIACTSTSSPGTDMIGGERDIFVGRTSGADTVVANANTTVLDNFSLSIGASTRGGAFIQWDGIDGNCALNYRGLAPLSLAPDDGIAIYVRSVDLNGAIELRIYTDAVNYSTFNYVIPNAIAPPGLVLYFPFEQFTDFGTGADFADVGAIELVVDGTDVDSLDMTIDFVNSDFTMDMGDLPPAYNNITLLTNNGARNILGTIYLGSGVGSGVNAEPDAQTSTTATGDTQDDGVDAITGSNWGDGSGQISIGVTAPIRGCVVGWIDWDGNGSFDVGGTTGSVSELVYNNYRNNGTSIRNIVTPTQANYGGSYPSTLNARFRIFEPYADIFTTLGIPVDDFGCPTEDSAGIGGTATEAQVAGLLTGLVRNGEVEDYQWSFNPTAVSLANLEVEKNTTPLIIAAGAALLVLVSGGLVLAYKRSRA